MSFKSMGLFMMYAAIAAVIGVGISAYVNRAPEGLEIGKCYVLKEEKEFGLRHSFIHMIHRKGKNNTYLSEQWDELKGWYGFTSVRHFDTHYYEKIECPRYDILPEEETL